MPLNELYSPTTLETTIRQRRHRNFPYHRHIGFDWILLEGLWSHQAPLLRRVVSDRQTHYVISAAVLQALLRSCGRRCGEFAWVVLGDVLAGASPAERNRN